MNTVAQITLKDGLMFPSGVTAPASYSCIIFCHLPPDWLDDNQLSMAKLEAVFEKLYGQHWRAGNDDGSKYVVLTVETRLLSDAEAQAAPWQTVRSNDEYRYWFYQVTARGELQQVKATELGTIF